MPPIIPTIRVTLRIRLSRLRPWLVAAMLVCGASSPVLSWRAAGEGAAPHPLTSTAIYQINSGGGAASPFMADEFFDTGNTFSTGGSIDTSSVTNPAPQAVYQTQRFGSFTYTFPNLTPGGAYTLRLHLVDIFNEAIGSSPFSIAINGMTVRSNYDVSAFAGALYKALTLAFNTTADSNGKITATFTSGGGWGKCNGIEVLSGALATISTAPTGLTATGVSGGVSLSWNAVSGATGYNVLRCNTSTGTFVRINASALTSPGYTDPGQAPFYYYEVLAVNGLGEGPPCAMVQATPNFPVQINCGGGAASPFLADQLFDTGSTYFTGTTIDTSSVTNPAPQAVYQTQRYDYSGPFTYTFPHLTPGGAYTLRLHLADLFAGPGYNMFRIALNGTTVRSGFDTAAFAGSEYKALTLAFNATADASGTIAATFSPIQNSALCNGIELLSGAQPTITTAPTGLKLIGSNGGLLLSWKAVSGATGYNVLHSDTSTGTFVRFNPTTIKTTTFTNTITPPCGYYEVLAVNDLGEGPPCAAVELSPDFFELAANPASITVARGSSAALTVTSFQPCNVVTLSLSVSGAPTGVAAWCFPAAVSFAYPVTNPTVTVPPDIASAYLNIVVGSNVTPGAYHLKITGKSGAFTQFISVPLTVN